MVGFGAWAIGGWCWGGCEREEALDALRAAMDAGITLIDTAPAYGLGRSEELVGEAVAGRRDQVVLATKCGLVWHTDAGRKFFDEEGQAIHRYLGPESIRYEVEQSLRRLGTEYIDLYQTHWQDETTPIADTMATLLELKAEGKIRAIGVSNATPAEMDEYRVLGSIDSDQERYSMLDRQAETVQLPYVTANGLAFLAYSPLANGLLTGKIGPDRTFAEGDMRLGNPRFSRESREKVALLLSEFGSVAVRHGATLAQVVAAWTYGRAGCSHILLGARSPAQAAENAAAGSLVLTEAEQAEITATVEGFAGV